MSTLKTVWPFSYLKLGVIYFQLEQIDQARKLFLSADELWNELADRFPSYVEFDRNLQTVRRILEQTKHLTAEGLKIQKRIDNLESMEQQVNTTPDPGQKVRLQNIIVDTLLLLHQDYPEIPSITTRLANAYGSLAWHYLFNRQFVEAEQAARNGLATDPDQEWIHTNLALGLLYQGKKKEALLIYEAYLGKAYNEENSWNDVLFERY